MKLCNEAEEEGGQKEKIHLVNGLLPAAFFRQRVSTIASSPLFFLARRNTQDRVNLDPPLAGILRLQIEYHKSNEAPALVEKKKYVKYLKDHQRTEELKK